MRLYSHTGAVAIDAPEGHFEPDDDGGFDSLPDAVFDRLHRSAVKGRRQWEDEIERSERLHGAELARKRDPASVHDALSELAAVTKQLAALQLAQAQANGVTAPEAPAKAGPEGKPEPRAEAKVEPDFKADPKPDVKVEAKAPVKPRPGSAKDAPAA